MKALGLKSTHIADKSYRWWLCSRLVSVDEYETQLTCLPQVLNSGLGHLLDLVPGVCAHFVSYNTYRLIMRDNTVAKYVQRTPAGLRIKQISRQDVTSKGGCVETG